MALSELTGELRAVIGLDGFGRKKYGKAKKG